MLQGDIVELVRAVDGDGAALNDKILPVVSQVFQIDLAVAGEGDGSGWDSRQPQGQNQKENQPQTGALPALRLVAVRALDRSGENGSPNRLCYWTSRMGQSLV